MEDKKHRKSKKWLGTTYKSFIIVPPTPGSVLQKKMQLKEKELRPGGRESWPIKIIEGAGKTLERTLVKTDPFNGNRCMDASCLPNRNDSNKINCRKNNVCYEIKCIICLRAGCSNPKDSDTYFGETGQNLHTRIKSHVSKFNSKQLRIKETSAFYKHLVIKHENTQWEGKTFDELFEVKALKSYEKVFTRVVEEGTFMVKHNGEILNSKSEWHQPKIIRATILQGGAENRNVNTVSKSLSINTTSSNIGEQGTNSTSTHTLAHSVVSQLSPRTRSEHISQRSIGSR